MHARQAGLEPHEHETHEHFQIEAAQAMARGIQSGEGLAVGNPDQATIQGVGPRVIRTGDPPSAMPLRAIDQARGAMPANIVEGPQLAVLAAQDHDGFAQELERMEITRVRHIVDVTDHLPALTKNRGFLPLEELGVPIDPRRQAVPLFLGRGAGRSGGTGVIEGSCSVHICSAFQLGARPGGITPPRPWSLLDDRTIATRNGQTAAQGSNSSVVRIGNSGMGRQFGIRD